MATSTTKKLSQAELKRLILSEVPKLIKKDPTIKAYLIDLTSRRYVRKETFDERFDRIMKELEIDREENQKKWEENQKKWEENQKRLDELFNELKRDREENQKKWEENQKKWEESQKKWEENQKKWEENQRKWEENQKRLDELHNELKRDREENQKKWEENQKRHEEHREELRRYMDENNKIIADILKEIKRLHQKHDSSIGALGARWGLIAESTFRDAIKGILEENTPFKVQRYSTFDEEGIVFGRPDQVELDLLINDGMVIIAEIKSSISKPDVAAFLKKIQVYEKKENTKVDKKLIISPMVHHTAMGFAQDNGIIIYGYAEDIDIRELQK